LPLIEKKSQYARSNLSWSSLEKYFVYLKKLHLLLRPHIATRGRDILSNQIPCQLFELLEDTIRDRKKIKIEIKIKR